MNEEKSMIEYKEQKGLLNWLKSKFEKLKQRLKLAQEVKKEENNGIELSEEDLEKVEAGYPNPQVIDFEERKEKIESLGKKSGELTEEQLDEVKAGYPNVVVESQQPKQDEQELSEEELEEVKAGMPIVEDDQR